MIQEQETEQAGQDVISASCNNCSNSDCNNCNELRVRENCPKHRSNTISNFCKTCDIAICGDCLVKDHLSHVLETLKDAYKRKVDELDIQKLTLDELHEKNRKRMDEVKEKTSYNVKEIKTIQSNLNSRYTTMIDKIDTMHDKNNKILKQYQTDHESWGQKEQDRLMANESTITRKIEQCSAARTYKLSFLIKRVEENRNLEDLNLPPLIEPDLPIASSTQFRDDEIQNQLGTVFKENDNKTSNVITFQLPFPAKGIMAQGREKVWIGSTREPDLQQYFITGDPIITAKTNCKVSNFAFKNSTEILLCDQYNRSVMCKSLENGKIETIVHFDDSSVPRGLCINGNNEIVLTRCFALSGMIQIYSMDGIMTKTILRDSRTNDYIFSEPIEIICNAAIGCCVLDAGKQEIIAVSEQGGGIKEGGMTLQSSNPRPFVVMIEIIF